jgi:hypothetical protein
MKRIPDSDSSLTLAGQAEGLLETVEAGHGLLGGTLAEKVPGEEAREVLNSSVDLVTANGCGSEPEPGLDVDGQTGSSGHVEVSDGGSE